MKYLLFALLLCISGSLLLIGQIGVLQVFQGGTGLATGTSGGIPYFSSASGMASSAALTSNVLVKGGGAGVAPSASSITDNGTVVTYGEAQAPYGQVIDSSTATTSLTISQCNSLVLLDRAAGTQVNLPSVATAPVGCTFSFFVKTTVTSNQNKTIVNSADTTTFIGGTVQLIAAGSGTTSGFTCNGSTHLDILGNGTTTGGVVNSPIYTLTLASSTLWVVNGNILQTGTAATPCSTT